MTTQVAGPPALLEVRDLRVTFGPRRKPFVAVDGVSLTVGANETVGLVVESGSGKTTVARSIVGLVRPASGQISYDGHPLPPGTRRGGELQRAIQMVFQDPRSSLNPRMTVASIIGEAWRTHPVSAPSSDRVEALHQLLADVGLDSGVAHQRAGQLSGGQRQRVSLARALAVKPRLLVCDEAVSALDVSVQAHILRLLDDLRRRHNLSMLFISHDLGVVHQIADRIAVMRRGVLVEEGPATEVLTSPHHDYTRSLLDTALELPAESGAARQDVHARGRVPPA